MTESPTPAPAPAGGCSICARIPRVCSLDLISGEGELPPASRELEGFPSSLGIPVTKRLSCPSCGTGYSLQIETGCMEWDLRLVRQSGPAGA